MIQDKNGITIAKIVLSLHLKQTQQNKCLKDSIYKKKN